MRIGIKGGRVLLATGEIVKTDIGVEEGRIVEIGTVNGADLTMRAEGRIVLPGMIDVHGDSFEQYIQPRPSTHFPLDIALAEADRQFISNGVTTAFLAQGHSWEGGLRGSEQAALLVDWLPRNRGRFRSDIRIHIRHETFNVDAAQALEGWIASRAVDLVVFNDHLPDYESRLGDTSHLDFWAAKAGVDTEEFSGRIRSVRARQGEVDGSIERLSRAATAAGIVTGSHDDPTPDVRAHYTALGATMAEFPLDLTTAEAARKMNQPVIMGAPNVVRGGSSAGNVSALDVVAARYCDVLCSDYYVPALLAAPFLLTRNGVLPFAEAWDLVSAGPARAVGLSDRGAVAHGKRADLVIVDDSNPSQPRVEATIVAGRVAYATGDVLAAV